MFDGRSPGDGILGNFAVGVLASEAIAAMHGAGTVVTNNARLLYFCSSPGSNSALASPTGSDRKPACSPPLGELSRPGEGVGLSVARLHASNEFPGHKQGGIVGLRLAKSPPGHRFLQANPALLATCPCPGRLGELPLAKKPGRSGFDKMGVRS